jgi:peroxiredoxin
MSRWETTSTFEADVPPSDVWKSAYADASAWPRWNAEIKSARLDGPLALGATARIVFRTGLRLRFQVVEYEEGRLFTDESRLPGARMGHRHLIEPTTEGGSRLTNTIYIEGPLAPLWRRILGPAAVRTLPDAQRAAIELVGTADRVNLVSQRPADIHELPDDLPVPEDDGAADHLLNAVVPSVVLSATSGERVDLAAAAADGILVVYLYPQTGVPGQPVPSGWDRIPGARGCTPQNCAFRDSAGELKGLGATVFGLSAQRLDEQREFGERESLPYPLLNDSEFRLADELDLPTFVANDVRYYRRLTFIAQASRISKVFYPVFPPQDNAADAIAWLRAQRKST